VDVDVATSLNFATSDVNVRSLASEFVPPSRLTSTKIRDVGVAPADVCASPARGNITRTATSVPVSSRMGFPL
jgi:hypothetical protein